MELFNSRADIATADVIERLEHALALIGEHQPWRLRRDIRAIRVERYACRGAFSTTTQQNQRCIIRTKSGCLYVTPSPH